MVLLRVEELVGICEIIEKFEFVVQFGKIVDFEFEGYFLFEQYQVNIIIIDSVYSVFF